MIKIFFFRQNASVLSSDILYCRICDKKDNDEIDNGSPKNVDQTIMLRFLKLIKHEDLEIVLNVLICIPRAMNHCSLTQQLVTQILEGLKHPNQEVNISVCKILPKFFQEAKVTISILIFVTLRLIITLF